MKKESNKKESNAGVRFVQGIIGITLIMIVYGAYENQTPLWQIAIIVGIGACALLITTCARKGKESSGLPPPPGCIGHQGFFGCGKRLACII